MTPRPYKTAKRREAAEQTRSRVLAATRELLMGPEGSTGLSIDAVAERAGVARMTVYYQFGSKAGLLEAFFDSIAEAGPFQRLGPAMRQTDPLRTLDEVVSIFGEFWERSRAAHGRLLAAARLDRDLEHAMQQRNERRRAIMRVVVDRLGPFRGKNGEKHATELADVLFAITGFPVYDALAANGRARADVVAMIQRLARAAVTAYLGRSPVAGGPERSS